MLVAAVAAASTGLLNEHLIYGGTCPYSVAFAGSAARLLASAASRSLPGAGELAACAPSACAYLASLYLNCAAYELGVSAMTHSLVRACSFFALAALGFRTMTRARWTSVALGVLGIALTAGAAGPESALGIAALVASAAAGAALLSLQGRSKVPPSRHLCCIHLLSAAFVLPAAGRRSELLAPSTLAAGAANALCSELIAALVGSRGAVAGGLALSLRKALSVCASSVYHRSSSAPLHWAGLAACLLAAWVYE